MVYQAKTSLRDKTPPERFRQPGTLPQLKTRVFNSAPHVFSFERAVNFIAGSTKNRSL
jgi:hypothetical protein